MSGIILPKTETAKLLNSTRYGTVTSYRQIIKHAEDAGVRISRKADIDLIKYAAWLFGRLKTLRETRARRATEIETDAYAKHARRMAERQQEASLSSRNIGDIPEVKNPERRARAIDDFRFFCRTYWSDIFYLPFNEDHETVIEKMILVAKDGGQFAIAMPRGSGKTALVERIALWTILRGERKYIIIFGKTEPKAKDILDEIKHSLETNELLFEDFPEICYPVRQLNGINMRSHGQLYKGKRTFIQWDAAEITFPNIPGSPAAMAIMEVTGLASAARGARKKGMRPDLLIFDDPQTDQSAANLDTSMKNADIIENSVKGMAAPGRKIAAFMPCTVIKQGDLAEMFLNRELKPQWLGERMKTLYEFPERMDLWNQYAQKRAQSLEKYGTIETATQFYRANRETMDAGARVAWKERFYIGEISAIQSAMEIFFDNEDIFFSEFQNDPRDRTPDAEKIKAVDIMARTNRLPRRICPKNATRLTAFVDVQDKMLYWAVIAWDDKFSGYVVDYGTTPEQRGKYFTLATADRTLAHITDAQTREGRWIAGYESITNNLVLYNWNTEDGRTMKIDRVLIDYADADAKPTIETFILRSRTPGVFLAYQGIGITAARRPMSEYPRKNGDRLGLNWRTRARMNERPIPVLQSDTNFWKSFVRARLAMPAADAGALTFYGDDPQEHRLIAEHLTAEFSVRTEGHGRTVNQWQAIPNRDNHWLDCIVGATVAASEQGITLAGTEGSGKRITRQVTEERRKHLETIRAERMNRRGI